MNGFMRNESHAIPLPRLTGIHVKSKHPGEKGKAYAQQMTGFCPSFNFI